MDDEMGDELLLAALPGVRLVERLRQNLAIPAGSHDIYLAYVGGHGCRFAGFLVSAVGSVDRLIAHCPVPADLEVASGMWRREVRRQKDMAIQIANRLMTPGRSPDVVWLNDRGDSPREIPGWVFSLCCIPLTFPWDGRHLHPRPFCPKLFESMAMQPEAPGWITQRMRMDHFAPVQTASRQSPQ